MVGMFVEPTDAFTIFETNDARRMDEKGTPFHSCVFLRCFREEK